MEGVQSEAVEFNPVATELDPATGAMSETESPRTEADPNPIPDYDQHTVVAQSPSRGARLRGPSVPVDMSPEFGSDGVQLAPGKRDGCRRV